MATLTTIRLPIPWGAFGLPEPLQTQFTCLVNGPPAWGWQNEAPALEIAQVDQTSGTVADAWDLDHVVLLVPEITTAIETVAAAAGAPRLRMTVRGRPTAFFRVGPLLEVIESPVRGPALFGIALVTTIPLEVVALQWRSRGLDVTDPHQAIQPGRRILTVRGTEAGLAVMSPDKAPGVVLPAWAAF